jgi:hypothetical protein
MCACLSCPPGKSPKARQVRHKKIFLFPSTPNHPYILRHPVPVEGRWPSSRTLGRDAVDAAALGAWWCSQGGLCSVSEHSVQTTGANARLDPPKSGFGRRRSKQSRVAAYGKSVWFWHPLLVSSWRRRVDPTGFRQSFNPSATVTKRIRRRGEHAISRRTIAQGMSECSACTCMLVCVFRYPLLPTRPRVQQAPGIPCALLTPGRMILENLGRIAPRDRGIASEMSPIGFFINS